MIMRVLNLDIVSIIKSCVMVFIFGMSIIVLYCNICCFQDEDLGDEANFNADFAVQYWISLGAPASKLVLGTPTYGRCWRLDSIENHGMLAPASQPGSAGPYTRSPGFLGYNEVRNWYARSSSA